jgi:hypothetical protein
MDASGFWKRGGGAAMSVTKDSAFKAKFHAADHPQELLRKALWEARHRGRLSPQSIIILCQNAGHKLKMSDRALRMFIDNETKDLTVEKYDALAAFWLHTPLGRALRYPDPKKPPKFDQLSSRLASGQLSLPEGRTADGAYFLYHGSYIEEDRFAVHVVEIDSDDDHILTVRDTIHDNIGLTDGPRESLGAMLFVDGFPQVVLYGTGYRWGFTLLIGTEPVYDGEGRLSHLVGAFLVMTKTHALAYRRFLMIRQPDGDREEMIAESGIFDRDQLSVPHRKRHSAAFDKLAKHKAIELPFAEPILT